MGVNKVVYGAVTIIDISDSTVTEDKLAKGETAYRADGEKIVGTMEDVTAETNEYTTKIASLESAVTALETELAGKASGGSGGGSVETCTVTVNSFTDNIRLLYYITYTNGAYEYHEESFTPNISSKTISNVPVGGYFYVVSSYSYCSWNYDRSKALTATDSYTSLAVFPLSDLTITVIDDD